MTLKTLTKPKYLPQETDNKPITGEMLFQMNNNSNTELIKGEIISMTPTGYLHGYVESNIVTILKNFVQKHNLGQVFSGEVGLYTTRNPDTIRGADVIFISHQRLAQSTSKSYLDVAPELIVEVISLNDRWNDIINKLEEYFNIGTNVVWLADPQKKQIYVYKSVTDVKHLTQEEYLSGDDILPNFSILVGKLFA